MISQAKIIAALIVFIALAAAVLAYGEHREAYGVQVTTDHYEAAIKAKDAEAATKLAYETEKTRLLERALQAATHQQELKDATNQKTVSDLTNSLRRAAGQSGRLLDPNAVAGCGPSGGGAPGAAAAAPGDRPADAPQAGGLLSVQLSDLLSRLLREADDVNGAYTSCRADAYTVRAGR